MSGRTPSFIVVGLVIIMFLLGLFYMSCSSKNTELRLSLDQFEERIRSLTIKHSESEKKFENLNIRKRELEEEKLNIEKQMEKKDSEINDLNTKLNEKNVELQSLKSDKKVVDEQLKEYKTISDTIASKDVFIEKLQQQLTDLKQANNEELNRIKQEYETLKNNRASQNNNQLPSNVEPTMTFVIPPQRFRPILSNNLTTKSLESFVQEPLNKLNNLTQEIKPQIVPAIIDVKDKVLNVFNINNNLSTTTTINPQQNINDDNNQQPGANQNVPAPPLANNAQRRLQPDHIESAQNAPKPVENNQVAVDNVQLPQLSNNSLIDNKNNKPSELAENDDEEQVNLDNLQENLNPIKQDNIENNNQPLNEPLLSRKTNRKEYRLNNRRQYRANKNPIQQEQRLDNGEEIDDMNNNEEYRRIRKRNIV